MDLLRRRHDSAGAGSSKAEESRTARPPNPEQQPGSRSSSRPSQRRHEDDTGNTVSGASSHISDTAGQPHPTAHTHKFSSEKSELRLAESNLHNLQQSLTEQLHSIAHDIKVIRHNCVASVALFDTSMASSLPKPANVNNLGELRPKIFLPRDSRLSIMLNNKDFVT
eukprot:jgi/Hompol1/29/HPOL_001032-RA